MIMRAWNLTCVWVVRSICADSAKLWGDWYLAVGSRWVWERMAPAMVHLTSHPHPHTPTTADLGTANLASLRYVHIALLAG